MNADEAEKIAKQAGRRFDAKDIVMVKNLYRCESCKAQTIAQAPAHHVTPMFLKCRVCGSMASSSMFALCQDALADAHVEFVYEGAADGAGPTGSKLLRSVPPYAPSWPKP